MRLLFVVCCVTVLACKPSEVPGDGGPSQLDPAFGADGTTRTQFGCGTSAYALAVAELADGRLVAGGRGCDGPVVAGFLSTGAIDPAFGDGGAVVLRPDAGYAEVRSVLVRADGQLLATAGAAAVDFVRQVSPSGVVDSAFATAADLALGTRFPRIHAVALQPDGKLLVGAGEELVRLGADGALDPTFGTGGVLRVTLFGPFTFLIALLVHPDGRIVLTGVEPSSDSRPFVAQLTAAGALDPGFGTKGVVMLKPTLGGVVQPTAAALQADGKILIAGWVRATSLAKKRPAIWRFTSAGLLDAPFGANGEAEAPTGGGDGAFSAVTVLANAKIVAAGFFKASSLPSEAWQVARFTASGELDATFAQAGSTVFNTGVAYSPGGAEALVVTAAGYVVAGRGFSTNDPASFLLARVLP